MSLVNVIPNKKKAIFLAKRLLVDFVYDAVNLEGIHYTFPEVQTLLDGVTVGGHKISDQMIVLNQAAAWKFLFELLETEQFSLSKTIACSVHAIAAKEEALTWGVFRKGGVTIAGTTYLPPKAEMLDQLWDQMLVEASAIDDIYAKAIYIFLQMSRIQFFYDVNKRMGRFMMNGLLLSLGYPAINLPASKQQTFNELMLDFYSTGEVTAMTQFMLDCLSPEIISIMNE